MAGHTAQAHPTLASNLNGFERSTYSRNCPSSPAKQSGKERSAVWNAGRSQCRLIFRHQVATPT
jgi:hypothetical protein